MSRVLLIKLIPIILVLQHNPVRIDRPILPAAAVAEDARKKRMGAQLIVVGDGQIM